MRRCLFIGCCFQEYVKHVLFSSGLCSSRINYHGRSGKGEVFLKTMPWI